MDSAQKNQAILDRGVAETVAYVRNNSPYYKQKFAALTKVSSTQDLLNFPVTTKHDIAQFNQDFWCVSQDQFVDVCTTSGTTGTPTLCPLTGADLHRLGAYEALTFKGAGLKRGDRVILAVTVDKCFMAGLAYFEGLRQLGATAIRVGAGSPAMLLSMVQRLGATAIISVPSFLQRVANYASQHEFHLTNSTIKKLICIGEPIRDSNWNLTPQAAGITQTYSAEIYSTYGVTEMAFSFCECTAGKGGHLLPEFLHAEILDDAGQPVPDGQSGQLVATTIGVQAMPLVRFATGDITFMIRTPCECGLATPRIGPILGRRDQMLKIKGTTVYPAAVQRVLAGIDQITDFVMIATSSAPLSDELEILLAIRGDAQTVLEIAREKLRGELKVLPNLRITSAAEIHEKVHSNEFRKQRVFIDERTK